MLNALWATEGNDVQGLTHHTPRVLEIAHDERVIKDDRAFREYFFVFEKARLNSFDSEGFCFPFLRDQL